MGTNFRIWFAVDATIVIVLKAPIYGLIQLEADDFFRGKKWSGRVWFV
jgi:hypothetical protein